MRAVFPAEVTGTIVTMVGIKVLPFSIRRFIGVDVSHPTLDLMALPVAVITLVVMMSLTVWGKGKLRLYSVLIGMIAGYVAAVDFGFLGPAQFSSQTHWSMIELQP